MTCSWGSRGLQGVVVVVVAVAVVVVADLVASLHAIVGCPRHMPQCGSSCRRTVDHSVPGSAG